MTFVPLALEEWHTRYESTVVHNAADSGVPAVPLRELVPDPEDLHALADLTLDYPPANGTPKLRELVADWAGVDPSWVLVTVGAAEAVGAIVATLVDQNDEIVVIEPGYRQVAGLATNRGARVRTVRLTPDRAWRLDINELDSAMSPGAHLIAVTNPSNPLGTVFTPAEMTALARAAARHGAWLLADEVYRGSERVGDALTPSFAGCYDRTVCVGSLSKSFGLPGLRIGWLIAPPDILDQACRRHEYATIAASTLSMYLAERALEPAIRAALLRRGRACIRAGYDRLADWIARSDGLLSAVPPAATATTFLRYHANIPSVEVAHAVRIGSNALVCPGALFGGEGHLRIGHAVAPSTLDTVLPAIVDAIRRLAITARTARRG
jgi:aspartate/methionine/tyrosine aminotransferase